MPSAPPPAPPSPAPAAAAPPRSRGGALLVAVGILASRLAGLVREVAFAHYLGNAGPAAALKAALRIPNFLQNLFGEGVLSGSFIPVYAQLLGRGEEEAADRLAGAVFGLLALTVALLSAAGVWAAPLLVDAIAPGFEGELRALTVQLVRILFPGTALLVLSAWCLGVLNSHRRFLLSYAAPVVWNLALISALLAGGGRLEAERLAVWVAWAAVAGSFLQFAVQVPAVLGLLGRFRPALSLAGEHVRRVLRSFGSVVVGRGVVQVSAYVDTALGSLLGERALAAMTYAQTLYMLPVSLFGMSVSAAELPELARTAGAAQEGMAERLRERLDGAARRVAFLVVPSAAAFLLLGDVVAATLFETGRFGAADSRYLWYLLMGSALGLLASTLGRLYASAFYALKDPDTPLRCALVRVVLGAALAWVLGLQLPGWLGLPRHLGAALITASSGVAALVEMLLLRRAFGRRVGRAGVAPGYVARLWACALAAGAVGLGVKVLLVRAGGAAGGVGAEWGGEVLPHPALHRVLTALAVLGPYGLVYFALTGALGVPEARSVVGRVWRRVRR